MAMKIGMIRFGLSLMIVVSFWTARLPAQEVLVVPETHYEPEHQPPNPGFMPRARPAPADHVARRALNHFGVGCKDDPYYPAWSSWRYEVNFVFGSSRNFFGIACPP